MIVRFTGTIVSCETRYETEVRIAKPVDFDPRWVVTIIVETADPDAPADVGEQTSFLFHSPAQLFHAAAEELAGQRYQFTIQRTEEDGRIRWSELTAKPVRGA